MHCNIQLPPVDLDRISAVSILAGEHEVILQTLSCLEKIAQTSLSSEEIPEQHAHQVLQILRQFADRCHHGKEEDVLFPVMEVRHPGFEPTAVMRSEHVQGRALIFGMAEALDAKHVRDFARNALEYVELLKQHIQKENEILFPIAQDMLSEAEDEQILDAYRAIEHDDMGTGVHEELLGIANDLAVFYGIPVASEQPKIMTLLTAICGCKKESHSDSTQNDFSKLQMIAQKVSQVHGESHPDMVMLSELIHRLGSLPIGELPQALKEIEDQLNACTDHYRPWLGACETVANLFNKLRYSVHKYSFSSLSEV